MALRAVYSYNSSLTIPHRSIVKPSADRIAFAREIRLYIDTLSNEELAEMIDEIIVTEMPTTTT